MFTQGIKYYSLKYYSGHLKEWVKFGSCDQKSKPLLLFWKSQIVKVKNQVEI